MRDPPVRARQGDPQPAGASRLRVTPQALAFVDDQAITIRDAADLLHQVEAALAAHDAFTLFTLNLDHLVKRRQSATFREAYARAALVTADGWPVVRLARRIDPTIALTTGADMVIPLCRLAARRRVPVFLFGSREAVLVGAAARLQALCPGLIVAGCEAPPAGFDPTGPAAHEAIQRIAASGAGLCFVALGAPKQELFADMAVAANVPAGFVCIGAALDFIAGAQRRAPSVLRRLRLEWAWRLGREPRRLLARYARCAILYLRLVRRPTA